MSACSVTLASAVDSQLRLCTPIVTFPDGWGLVRASNTNPYLTLRFEARTDREIDVRASAARDVDLTAALDLEAALARLLDRLDLAEAARIGNGAAQRGERVAERRRPDLDGARQALRRGEITGCEDVPLASRNFDPTSGANADRASPFEDDFLNWRIGAHSRQYV